MSVFPGSPSRRGCHDGGATRLVNSGPNWVDLRVEGTCVKCPQIGYTKKMMKDAFRARLPHVKVHFDGDQGSGAEVLPVNRQHTLGMFMNATGVRFSDLDTLLQARGSITDADLMLLGRFVLVRRAFSQPEQAAADRQ